MVIPPLEPDGKLPSGIHVATWAELVCFFGGSARRQLLLAGLKAGLESLHLAGCRTAYVDGSFVTAKESPGDFDACWDARGVRGSLLDPVLLTFDQGRALQKAKYGGEFFPAHFPADVSGITYLEFFQQDKHTNATKGIVALDLGSLP
jgi:hypothetical protein